MKLKQLLLFVIILLTSCFISFSLFSQPPTTGLLGYFQLNGNTTKIAGSANITCSAVGTTYTTNNVNIPNYAVQFGNNLNSYLDFVDNGTIDFVNTNFTVTFSFFFNGNATSGLIDNCLNYGGWGVWLWSTVANTWNIQFNYKNNSVGSAAATAFTTGVWHNVAAVRNNGTISLYIDGIFRLSATEGTTTSTYPINANAGAMCFGSFSPPRYNPFGGKMDEIRFYNRALTATEIASIFVYALPLKLGELSAVKKQSGVQLNWETLNEQNTSHFEIEKSTDGTNWSSIGRVNAAGNSSDKKYYSFTDAAPGIRTVFYRLKMADIDGAYTYSRVVTVKMDASNYNVSIFPNPATEVLQVQIPGTAEKQAKIIITDAAGRQLSTQAIKIRSGMNTISIPVLQLVPGAYYLVLEDDEGRQTKQFIKK